MTDRIPKLSESMRGVHWPTAICGGLAYLVFAWFAISTITILCSRWAG